MYLQLGHYINLNFKNPFSIWNIEFLLYDIWIDISIDLFVFAIVLFQVLFYV